MAVQLLFKTLQKLKFPSMPSNALTHVRVDYKLPLTTIAETVNRLAQQEWLQGEFMGDYDQGAANDMIVEQDLQQSILSRYTCPDCHGPLSKIQDGSPTRYRCRVGHAYGKKSLYDAQAIYVEQVLWSSFQALEAKADMERNLVEEAEVKQDPVLTQGLAASLEETERRIKTLVQMLQFSHFQSEDKN
jgi:two-component system chemotaxis response regulator CheB